jgi:aryl-alcohol dehydrogenase-like predicted oxidoreductase
MHHHSFGATKLRVSALGLGCSCLGGNLQRGSRRQSITTLHAALDAGINFYDTADSYGQGQSEKLLGQAFKHQRDQVIFATKAGYCLSSAGSFLSKAKPVLKPLVRMLKSKGSKLDKARGSFLKQNFSRDYLIQSVEGSLKRLQTDYLDLFQLHSPAAEVIQNIEVFETLADLQQQGKLRHYGVSCETTEDALLCLDVPGLSSLQVEVNLLTQEAITKLLPAAQQRGIAVIARQPFASGKLFKGSDEPIESEKIRHFAALAEQHNCSLARLALQFIHQLEGVDVVIAGANTLAHLAENVRAVEAPPLSDEQIAQITQNFAETLS